VLVSPAHYLHPQMLARSATHSSDDQTTVLQSIVFHWDAIPSTAQFVYRIHFIQCGKGLTRLVELISVDLSAIEEVIESDLDFDQAEDSAVTTDIDKFDLIMGACFIVKLCL
jgi:hypothetical protein